MQVPCKLKDRPRYYTSFPVEQTSRKIAINKLKIILIQAFICHYFNIECYSKIFQNFCSYKICVIFCWLHLYNLYRCNLVFFIRKKIICAKIQEKKQDSKLLAMGNFLKNQQNDFSGINNRIYILRNDYNLCKLNNIKNLSL